MCPSCGYRHLWGEPLTLLSVYQLSRLPDWAWRPGGPGPPTLGIRPARTVVPFAIFVVAAAVFAAIDMVVVAQSVTFGWFVFVAIQCAVFGPALWASVTQRFYRFEGMATGGFAHTFWGIGPSIAQSSVPLCDLERLTFFGGRNARLRMRGPSQSWSISLGIGIDRERYELLKAWLWIVRDPSHEALALSRLRSLLGAPSRASHAQTPR